MPEPLGPRLRARERNPHPIIGGVHDGSGESRRVIVGIGGPVDPVEADVERPIVVGGGGPEHIDPQPGVSGVGEQAAHLGAQDGACLLRIQLKVITVVG